MSIIQQLNKDIPNSWKSIQISNNESPISSNSSTHCNWTHVKSSTHIQLITNYNCYRCLGSSNCYTCFWRRSYDEISYVIRNTRGDRKQTIAQHDSEDTLPHLSVKNQSSIGKLKTAASPLTGSTVNNNSNNLQNTRRFPIQSRNANKFAQC